MIRFFIPTTAVFAFFLGWVAAKYDPNEGRREMTVAWISVSEFLDADFDERQSHIRMFGHLELIEGEFRVFDSDDQSRSIGISSIEPQCLNRHVGTIVEITFIPTDSFERDLLWLKSFIEVEWFGTISERRDPERHIDTQSCPGYPYVWR